MAGETFRGYVERRGSRLMSPKDLEKRLGISSRQRADDITAEAMQKSTLEACKWEDDPEGIIKDDLNRFVGKDYAKSRSVAEEERILAKAEQIKASDGVDHDGAEMARRGGNPSSDEEILRDAEEILYRRALKEYEESEIQNTGASEGSEAGGRYCKTALGWFKEIIVPSDGGTTSTCNEFGLFGQSTLQVIYDVVERGSEPPDGLADTSLMPWNKAADKWKSKMNIELFDKESEGDALEEMYALHLPPLDPLHNYLMRVERIILPRIRVAGESPSFGLSFNLLEGQMTITKVTNKHADLFVGDIIVSVNNESIATADGNSTVNHVQSVAGLIKGTADDEILELGVLRQYRRGSRLGGLYRENVHDARCQAHASAPTHMYPSPSQSPLAAEAALDLSHGEQEGSTAPIHAQASQSEDGGSGNNVDVGNHQCQIEGNKKQPASASSPRSDDGSDEDADLLNDGDEQGVADNSTNSELTPDEGRSKRRRKQRFSYTNPQKSDQ